MNVYQWTIKTDGPLTETGLTNKLEQMGYVCTLYTYPKGTFFPAHTHETDKIDAVLKGQFKISMTGESVILNAGEYVIIPKGTIHSAEVIGEESVVSIDAVKSG